MKKLLAVSVLALMASCSGHHAYAMDLSKESRYNPRVEDQRGDYIVAEEDVVWVQKEMWVRIVYMPAPFVADQTLKICIKRLNQADYTGQPMVCLSIIQQNPVEKGLY